MSIDVNVQNDLVIVTESSEDITVNVSNAPGPAGPGVPVGGSTGQVLKKLSNTNYDTYWALDGGGVPYSGATGDVDLGEYELKAGQFELDTTPTGTAGVAVTRWNDTNGVSETTLKGGNVVLKNGIDLVARVVNKVTPNTTLTKAAYQAVRVSGAQGQRLAVALAQANNDANSADTIGLVTETINANQEGFIMTVGQLENINTTGSLQGETWADGDVLYLSPTTAGAITKVKPTGNGHIVVIGYVEYAHVNNGKIYVKVMNGWELDELHDVAIVSPANNEALIYESSTSLWKNKTIATALGYTPQAALTLTTTGTSGAATLVGATLNIPQYSGGGGGTPAGPNGAVQYNGSGSFAGTTSFLYDDTTKKNTISFATASEIGFFVTNGSTASGAGAKIELANNLGFSAFNKVSTGSSYKIVGNGDLGIYNSTADIAILNDIGKIKFGAGGATTAQMTLTAAGRLLLGTTSESTYLLDVNGSVKFGTAGSGTGMYWDNANNRLGIGTNSPTQSIDILTNNSSSSPYGLKIKNSNASGRSTFFVYNDNDEGGTFGTYGTTFGATAFRNNFGIGATKSLIFGSDADIGSGGTSKISFVTGGYTNSAAMTLTAAGRLLLGTTTEGTYILDVNGTARVSDNVLIQKDQNGPTYIQVKNTTSGTLSQVQYAVLSDASAGGAGIGKASSTYTTSGIINASDFYISNNSTAGDLAIANDSTGKIKFRTGSSSNTPQMTLTANGRLLLGTTTDTTNKLSVVGGNILFSNSINSETTLLIQNATNGAAASVQLSLSCGGNQSALGKYSPTSTSYKIINSNDVYLYTSSAGDISLINDFATGKIKFASGGSSAAQMTLTAAGRLLLGTTTESTFIFDAVGTARVSGDMVVNGMNFGKGVNSLSDNTILGRLNGQSITTGNNNTIVGSLSSYKLTSGINNVSFGDNCLYNNQTGNNNTAIGSFSAYSLTGSANIAIGYGSMSAAGAAGGNTSVGYDSLQNVTGGNNTALGRISLKANTSGNINVAIGYASLYQTTTGSQNIGIGNEAGGYNTTGSDQVFINSLPRVNYDGDRNGSPIYITQNSTIASQNLYFNGNTRVSSIGSGSPSILASAQLQVDSTTKGFLPPRMTNAQRAAISSPAVGLMVYCTDTVEGLYVYKSTGWTFVI